MPLRLLPLLTDQPQSGEQLGAQLGVNRVTVNSLAKKLLEDGVPLLITRSGYALEPGTPAPALVKATGSLGQALRYFGTVGSTQDEIRSWADDPVNPAPYGAVVVAERQTAGRGRRGRPWDTIHGTLALSVLLCGDAAGKALSLSELASLPLAVGVALHSAAGVGGLKWPNDLLAPDGRKLAGILLEADLRGEEARRAVLGIGINVTAAPENAAWLSEFRPDLTRAALLADLLLELEHWLAQPTGVVLEAWRKASYTLGKTVQISTPSGPIQGVARDINGQGSLILETPGGPQLVHAGDVQLIGELSTNKLGSGGPSP